MAQIDCITHAIEINSMSLFLDSANKAPYVVLLSLVIDHLLQYLIRASRKENSRIKAVVVETLQNRIKLKKM